MASSPTTTRSAIGAIQAIKASGADVKPYVIGGVDATQDASGDAGGRAQRDGVPGRRRPEQGALDAALKLAKGEAVDRGLHPVPARHPGQHRRLPLKLNWGTPSASRAGDERRPDPRRPGSVPGASPYRKATMAQSQTTHGVGGLTFDASSVTAPELNVFFALILPSPSSRRSAGC